MGISSFVGSFVQLTMKLFWVIFDWVDDNRGDLEMLPNCLRGKERHTFWRLRREMEEWELRGDTREWERAEEAIGERKIVKRLEMVLRGKGV